LGDFFSALSNFFAQLGNWIAQNWQLVISTAIGIAVTIATAGLGAPAWLSFLAGGLAQSISEALLNWFFPSGTQQQAPSVPSIVLPFSQMMGLMMGAMVQMMIMQMLMSAMMSMMSMIM